MRVFCKKIRNFSCKNPAKINKKHKQRKDHLKVDKKLSRYRYGSPDPQRKNIWTRIRTYF